MPDWDSRRCETNSILGDLIPSRKDIAGNQRKENVCRLETHVAIASAKGFFTRNVNRFTVDAYRKYSADGNNVVTVVGSGKFTSPICSPFIHHTQNLLVSRLFEQKKEFFCSNKLCMVLFRLRQSPGTQRSSSDFCLKKTKRHSFSSPKAEVW